MPDSRAGTRSRSSSTPKPPLAAISEQLHVNPAAPISWAATTSPLAKASKQASINPFSKKGFSAHEVQRQLGHNRYEPIWLMMQKVRTAMGKSERNSVLKGMVEMDEAYISTHTPKKLKERLKRGKGSQKKQKIMVMAESFPLENNQGFTYF